MATPTADSYPAANGEVIYAGCVSPAPAPSPGPPPATAFTLSGPTSGTTATPATFTVTPNGPLSASTVVTLAASNSGALSVPSLTFASGATAAQTFTVTRATDGTSSVSITNDGGLTNSGTPISFASSSTITMPTWDADLGITAVALPSAVTTAGFTLLASGSRDLDWWGSFTAHQGMVYFPPLRSMICFGNETHSSEPYYANSPRIIELDSMKLSRAVADDPFANFRIDDIGIPWANAAHTAPWGMHGFRQQFIVGSELWVAYNAINHANLFQDSIVPIPREGAATDVRSTMWAFNPSTKAWRYIDGGANNAAVAAMLPVSYGLVYSASRNSIMGSAGGNWRELFLADFTLGVSQPAIPVSGVNNYSLLLNDGRVLTGAGGEGDTTLFCLVDPASPGSYTQVLKASYPAISGLSTRDTGWAKLPSGRVIAFLKDVAGGLLRPWVFDPTDNSFTDTGHSLNVGTAGSSTTFYWQQCEYAADFGQVLLASNVGGLLRVWSYKPSSGV